MDGYVSGNVNGVVLKLENYAAGSKDFHLNILQTSASSHEYTRTGTTLLDDNDFG